MNEVTRILNAIERGDVKATDELLPVVYEELRLLAAQKLAHESPGQTLQATALVHEAYLRLLGDEGQTWENRAHFFAAAAEAMRRILIDNARRKRRLKRGGGHEKVELGDAEPITNGPDDDLIALDEALEKLARIDKVKADLVKLRFFAGLTGEQAAKVLGISHNTADRYWAYARSWLHLEIARGESGEGSS
jgi:RNA polymerase sigma factor (TIGR02999 family)